MQSQMRLLSKRIVDILPVTEQSMGKHDPILNKSKRRKELLARLPDRNDPVWREEMRRQSKLAAESPYAAEDQAFVDAITDWEGMPPP
jgi:Protein  of unknown function (DUF3018)